MELLRKLAVKTVNHCVDSRFLPKSIEILEQRIQKAVAQPVTLLVVEIRVLHQIMARASNPSSTRTDRFLDFCFRVIQWQRLARSRVGEAVCDGVFVPFGRRKGISLGRKLARRSTPSPQASGHDSNRGSSHRGSPFLLS